MSSVLFWGLFKRTSWKALLCSQSRCSDTAPRSEIPNCGDSSQHERRVGRKAKLQKEVIFNITVVIYTLESQKCKTVWFYTNMKCNGKKGNTKTKHDRKQGKNNRKTKTANHKTQPRNFCQKRRSGLLTIPPHKSLGWTD